MKPVSVVPNQADCLVLLQQGQVDAISTDDTILQGLGVTQRLGQFHAVRNPGLTFLIPFVDRLISVDMRETPRTGDRQDVITSDNVSLAVDATIFSQVIEPARRSSPSATTSSPWTRSPAPRCARSWDR